MTIYMWRSRLLTAMALTVSLCAPACAGEVRAAVASNFTAPMSRIAPLFEQATGHKLTLSFGSTGKFYTQIKHGAPYDVFIAADEKTPLRLVDEHVAQADSRFVYALGKLALWSMQPGLVDDKARVLDTGRFDRLAIADPRLAPYGMAAQEVLTKRKLWDAVQSKLVRGENITQAYQFVASQNATLGFVALSQIMRDGKVEQGSWWLVPQAAYAPIKQSAVMLSDAQDRAAAQALLTFLRGEQAAAIIRSYGYGLPE